MLLFFDGFNDTGTVTAPVAVKVSGNRNTFDNCHIAGVGHSTFDVADAGNLLIDGAQECLFDNCYIGLDTISRGGAANWGIGFDSYASRIKFKDCLIYGFISHDSNHPLVKVLDTAAFDRWIWFKDCLFEYLSENQALTPTTYFVVPAVTPSMGQIILQNCMGVSGKDGQASDWCATGRKVVWANMGAATAAAGGGLGTDK